MKVVCVEKAYFMHNYTIGGRYDIIIDDKVKLDCIITDDAGRKMWWNGCDVQCYFKLLRELNLELIND